MAVPAQEFDLAFKLQLVGNSGVGKSSLLLRFAEDKFDINTKATIGVDFKVKYTTQRDQRCKLMVWDTAGQERFRTLTSSYYRGAHGVIFVYDVTSRESFDALNVWMAEVEQYKSFPDVVKLLVGNKLDCVQAGAERQVPQSVAEEFARDNGMMWIEASAKTKEGVQQTFDELVSKILDTSALVDAARNTKKTGVSLKPGQQRDDGRGGVGLCC